MKIYIIGSLRNPRITDVANVLRRTGHDIFEDWASPGPDVDTRWQEYEKARGRGFVEALNGHHAQNQFHFDKTHLDSASVGVLVLPAGKSAHLELGYLLGQGKQGYILLDGDPERYELMYAFATGVFLDIESLCKAIQEQRPGGMRIYKEGDR